MTFKEEERKVTVNGMDYYLRHIRGCDIREGMELSQPAWLPIDNGMVYHVKHITDSGDGMLLHWTHIDNDGNEDPDEQEWEPITDDWWTVHDEPLIPPYDYVPTQEGDRDDDI